MRLYSTQQNIPQRNVFILRSVQDLGKLLYPEVILNNDAVTVVDFVHPTKDVINQYLYVQQSNSTSSSSRIYRPSPHAIP